MLALIKVLLLSRTMTYCLGNVTTTGAGESSENRSHDVQDIFHTNERPLRHDVPVKIVNDKRVQLVQQLIERLIRNYNKEAVLDKPIVIHMDVLLLQVKNTNEKEGILESVVALMIEWHDQRMRWNPADYANLTFLSLATEQVWLPDIAMTNSADHLYSISRDNRFTVRVSYDGVFKFVPTGTAKTWCDMKLIKFPFDAQQCYLEFESWSLDSTTMTFDGLSSLLIDDSFKSGQFELCNPQALTYHHTYEFTGETFTRVVFSLTVKRKGMFYVINLIFPIMVLSLIQTLSFLIPCNDTTTDRIAFGTTNLLTLVVYQTIITEQLPKTSDAVTALSRYVITLILTAAFGIFESVLVERLHGRKIRPPPFILMRLLRLSKIPILLHETAIQQQRQIERSVQTPNSSSEYQNFVSPYSSSLTTPITSMSEDIKRSLPNYCPSSSPSAKLCILPYECPKGGENNGTSRSSHSTTTCSERLFFITHENVENLQQNRHCQLLEDNNDGAESVQKPPEPGQTRKIGNYNKEHKAVLKSNAGAENGQDFYRQQWLNAEPSSLWSEFAFKLDSLMFILSITSAFVAPTMMFFPLLVESATSKDCK